KKIIKKHWHILKEDDILNPILPNQPNIVFRGAPNFKSILTTNFTRESPVRGFSFFPQTKGFYKCKQCIVCRTTDLSTPPKVTQFMSNRTKKMYNIYDFIGCNTKNVIYLLECPCGLQYVGMTTRCLKTRLSEHCRNIKNGYLNHTVSKHFIMHNKDPKLLKCI
ncbi:Hypothetical predicted protein, partial [Pelobates cultripes]